MASVLQPSAKNNVASAFGRECFSEPILIICKASYTFYKQILRNRPVAHIGNTWCWMFIIFQNLVTLNLKSNFYLFWCIKGWTSIFFLYGIVWVFSEFSPWIRLKVRREGVPVPVLWVRYTSDMEVAAKLLTPEPKFTMWDLVLSYDLKRG